MEQEEREFAKKKYVCCICDKKRIGFGHNPHPIRESGKCCGMCNSRNVIPTRMRKLMETKK